MRYRFRLRQMNFIGQSMAAFFLSILGLLDPASGTFFRNYFHNPSSSK